MIEQLFCANQAVDEQTLHQLMSTLDQPSKPEGALGRLEEVFIRLAGHQACLRPDIKSPRVVIFASDHGVAIEKDSA